MTTYDDIFDDEEQPRLKRVGRLSDMETREVSIVDRAANKRRFLVVKRQGEDMTETAVLDDETKPQGEVSKGIASAFLQQAHERLDYLNSAIDAAEVAEKFDDQVTAPYEREARSIQFMLKSVAGVTCKSSGLLIPVGVNLDSGPALTTTFKAEVLPVIREVTRRIESLKQDLDGVQILDAGQQRTLNDTADLLAKVATTKADHAVVMLSSLNDDQRATVLEAVEKSVQGLTDVYIALQTDGVTKNAVANDFEVGALIHDHAAHLERAVNGILKNATGEFDLIDAAVEEMRALQTVEKAYKVKSMGDRFAVMDDDKIKGMFGTKKEADEACARMNARKAQAKTSNMETLMNVMINPTTETTATAPAESVEKIGAPMQGDRLNRLKSAVSLFKQALGDLRAGSVSLEKFKQVGEVLSGLVREMQVAKRAAANNITGVEDTRSADPVAPNMGSGYTTDPGQIGSMRDVFGPGTENTADIMKSVEGMVESKVAEVAKAKDEEIEALRAQVATLAKRRGAPSLPPSDGELDNVAKSHPEQDPDQCYWPSDLAAWDGEESRDLN